jgi:endonuclease/exonuclease/phosphatase family metal-dependent hydrolase
LVTHFGLNDSEKENAVRTVMEQIEDERCVLMGDFNVTPDNGLLAPIRERMKDAADAFSTPFLSFPSDVPDRKIDYVFVSPDVTVLSADIPALVVSDHRPHVAEIQFENSL